MGGGNEGDVTGPDLVGFLREGLIEQEVGRRSVGAAIAGFWLVVLGLDGFEAALLHNSTDSLGGAGDLLIGEFLPDSAVAVAAAVPLENGFDVLADLLVCALGEGGCRGVIVAAAGDLESGTDRTDAMAAGVVDVPDHFAELGRSLVPRMTAAFFKMSFSILRRAFSRRRERRSSASLLSPAARSPPLPTCAPCELCLHL